jgi:NAD(P)-dependent dehydrogenase (short-subunit alcohol dehydrogenase family)
VLNTDRLTAVVTGASRGAGRGIAIALGAAGWRVYVTGRTIDETDTARLVTEAGGDGIAVTVDHHVDASVAALFSRVAADGSGLDLLVNNAASVHDDLTGPKPFWQKPIELSDIIDVGLRSAYVASWYAAPLMVERGRGLIGFTSSPGSVCYMHGPAYGAQKAGVDKLAADMAVDFRGTGVVPVSIWMGILLTEKFRSAFAGKPDALAEMEKQAETPAFTGHLIDALYRDPELAELAGHTLIGAELALRYGVTDEDGRQPPSHRDWLGSPREPSSVVVR